MKVKNSIIVPAYNEEKRSSSFIPDLIDFTRKHVPNSEVIIVDDGSKDKTREKIKGIIRSKNASLFVKIIGYSKNKGKGNAVSYGVKAAKGDKVLFIDADGSIPPSQIPLMLNQLDKYDVVAGDRISAKSRVKSNLLRKMFSLGFNSFVSLLFQYSYRDNLCGFKGFKKSTANDIFSNLIDKRWVFDVELFYKIKKKGYSLYFLPIEWHHVSGSRINLIRDPIKWFFRLFALRIKLIGYK